METRSSSLEDAFRRLCPRTVHGISAMLLPYTDDGAIDWTAFERHLVRTHRAGLDVAVNMDTGFVDLLGENERREVLERTRKALGSGPSFYAGAFPDRLLEDERRAYREAIAAIERQGGVPVVVQSPATRDRSPEEVARWYREILDGVERALAFELSPVFAPHGHIWDDETFARLLEIPQVIGAKHSSLDRRIELRRLAARDRLRPDFRVHTGNDLAIDMVAYGSDYLLGLSTFAPEAFARRDRALADGDVAFLHLNDSLQHLGNVGFRAPVPAYKHSAVQFLHITGGLERDAIHPRAPRRPSSDRILLFDCAVRLGMLDDPGQAYAERVEPFL